ncbi:MAG: PIN domain-containing protein [Gaiellaceae bacterium]
MTVLLDTNVLVRHFTDDPPYLAARARAFLQSGDGLFLVDLVVAEVVYVLESYYEATRTTVARHVRSALGSPTIDVADAPVLLRALELYEFERLDFPEAYLAALAEGTGAVVASFDRSLDRVETVTRVEP